MGGLLLTREHDDDDAPSELLAPLLEEWRDVLVTHVLSRLDATDYALLARVAKPWLAVVLASNLPRAGKGGRDGTGGAVPLKLKDFVGSVEMLAWAKVGPGRDSIPRHVAGSHRFQKRGFRMCSTEVQPFSARP
jgi:hypothetical protein